MKNGVIQAVAAAAMVTGAASAQAEAVQWRVEDGGNGHWYACSADAQQWNTARLICQDLGGHLATITSSGENAFAHAIAPVNGAGTWLGANAPTGQCTTASAYEWVTGEQFLISPWAPSEPNGGFGSEDCAIAYWYDASLGPLWNDVPQSWSCKFLIEWSADCNSDGIVDFSQIRAGELDDTNANNIPDCCEQGTPCSCPGDLNGDGVVNGADIGAILAFWGPNPVFAAADITRDGQVNGADLGALLSTWGPCGQ